MFNNKGVNKTPTVSQIQAIIKYMEEDLNATYNFSHMMSMQRPKPDTILLDLNNAHRGKRYEIIFHNENEIISFKQTDSWMS